MPNYKSATYSAVRRATVEETVGDEIRRGNNVISATKPTVVSALEAIPKPNSTEVRLIHDCCRPDGHAVNDYITKDKFRFQTLDDATRALQPGYYMKKIDLRHAYLSVSIHPSNYQATGCKCRFEGDDIDTFSYDTRLPFGAKCSPEVFHRLTQAVRRMMAKRGYHEVIVYLDDFLVIESTYRDCKEKYDSLLALLQDLGFSISWRQLVPPTQCLTFLGVELNTTACTLTPPAAKLQEFQRLIVQFQHKQRAQLSNSYNDWQAN